MSLCLCFLLTPDSRHPSLQRVLPGSSGRGGAAAAAAWLRLRPVSAAARTFTLLPSTADTRQPRAASVRRASTGARVPCVSSPPSAPATTRASFGRYTHTQSTAAATAKINSCEHHGSFCPGCQRQRRFRWPRPSPFALLVLFTHNEGLIRR